MGAPFGKYMAPNRSGGRARRLRQRLEAGTIDSRNGSASVVPMPRSIVRRGNARFVMNMETPLSRVRVAGRRRIRVFCRIWNGALFTMPRTSAENRSRCRAGVAHDAAHHRHVVILQAAAERINQQLLGQRPHEHVGVLEQRRPQADHAHRASPVGHRALGVHVAARPRASRQAPTALKFSSENPSPSIVR